MGHWMPFSSWCSSMTHGHEAFGADAVGAHDDGLGFAVFVQVGGAHGDAVLGAQLEDVADFDAARGVDGRPAVGAGIAVGHGDEVGDDIGSVVAAVVGVAQVVAGLVGAGHQVGADGDQVVHDQQHLVTLDAERRAVAGLGADGQDLLDDGRAQAAGLDGVGELGFVQLHVAAHDGKDKLLGYRAVRLVDVGHHEDGLGRLALGNAEEGGQVGNGFAVGRGHLFQGQRRSRGRRGLAEDGDLAVGAVAAVVAQDERVLADGGEGHELVGHRAAHHADVGADGDHVQVAAVEDVEVGLVEVRVVGIEAGLVPVERVGVLHRELAHADDAGAGRGSSRNLVWIW